MGIPIPNGTIFDQTVTARLMQKGDPIDGTSIGANIPADGTFTTLVVAGKPIPSQQYVDGKFAGALQTIGGTLTGPLTLAADPVAPLQPATKQYTDAADNQRLLLSGGALSGDLTSTGAFYAGVNDFAAVRAKGAPTDGKAMLYVNKVNSTGSDPKLTNSYYYVSDNAGSFAPRIPNDFQTNVTTNPVFGIWNFHSAVSHVSVGGNIGNNGHVAADFQAIRNVSPIGSTTVSTTLTSPNQTLSVASLSGFGMTMQSGGPNQGALISLVNAAPANVATGAGVTSSGVTAITLANASSVQPGMLLWGPGVLAYVMTVSGNNLTISTITTASIAANTTLSVGWSNLVLVGLSRYHCVSVSAASGAGTMLFAESVSVADGTSGNLVQLNQGGVPQWSFVAENRDTTGLPSSAAGIQIVGELDLAGNGADDGGNALVYSPVSNANLPQGSRSFLSLVASKWNAGGADYVVGTGIGFTIGVGASINSILPVNGTFNQAVLDIRKGTEATGANAIWLNDNQHFAWNKSGTVQTRYNTSTNNLEILSNGTASLTIAPATGSITLGGNPTGGLQAAPKQYVDYVAVSLASSAAVGDNVTDDTAAIQAFLNTLTTGAEVRVPKTYYIAGTLTVPIGVKLVAGAQSWASPLAGAGWLGYGVGFTLNPATGSIIMSHSSAVCGIKVLRQGLLANPTTAQVTTAITTWSGETSLAISIPSNTENVLLEDVFIVGFRTGVKCQSGRAYMNRIVADCITCLEVTGAGDSSVVSNWNCRPFYSFGSACTQNATTWMRPGDGFWLHGQADGWILESNSVIFWQNCYHLQSVSGVSVSNCAAEVYVGTTLATKCFWLDAGSDHRLKGLQANFATINYHLNNSADYYVDCCYSGASTGTYSTAHYQIDGAVSYGEVSNSNANGGSTPAINVLNTIALRHRIHNIEIVNSTAAPAVVIPSSVRSLVSTLDVRSQSGTQDAYFNSYLPEKMHIVSSGAAPADASSSAPLTVERNDGATTNTPVLELRRTGTAYGSISIPNLSSGVVALNATQGGWGVALIPGTNGYVALAAPDGTASGGNARGAAAVDLQITRAAAAQVASGAASSILCGANNQVSGAYAAILNGTYNVVTGNYSLAMGNGASDRGRLGYMGFGGDAFPGTSGVFQIGWAVLCAYTTTATPQRMTADFNGTAGAANVVNIPDNTTYRMDITLVANDRSGVNASSWKATGVLLKRGSGAASTTLANGAFTQEGTIGTATGWAVSAATADTTNGGLSITVTGQASHSITWTANIAIAEAQ